MRGPEVLGLADLNPGNPMCAVTATVGVRACDGGVSGAQLATQKVAATVAHFSLRETDMDAASGRCGVCGRG